MILSIILFAQQQSVMLVLALIMIVPTTIILKRIFPSKSKAEFNNHYFFGGMVMSLLGFTILLNTEFKRANYVPLVNNDSDDKIYIPIEEWHFEEPKQEKKIPKTQKVKSSIVSNVVPVEDLVETKKKTEINIPQNRKLKLPALKFAKAKEKPAKKDNESSSKIYQFVEKMPRFPGCDNASLSEEEKYKCAEKKLMAFIGRTLDYPTYAIENGIQGKVTAKFVVDTTGFISDISIIQSLNKLCDAAAMEAINKMNLIDKRWEPGIQGGKKVKVQFTMPIVFKLR